MIGLVGASACGPGLVVKDPRPGARETLTAAARDVDAMTRLVRGPIVTIRNRGIERLEGRFRVCIDDQGVVESVLPVKSTGVTAYDERLIAGMRAWRYSPFLVDDEPVPVCTHQVFIYHQNYGWPR